MNVYLVVPEAIDLIDHCGTDMICGHFDDLEVYQHKTDADHAAYKMNQTGSNTAQHVVIELEVQ